MRTKHKFPKIIIPEYLTTRFVPNLEAADLLEYFLVSAVTSFLLIRAFLNLTGFPQIGGGGFHIAHMLWGGLLMLISIVFFTAFLNSTSKVIAVIFGGIGFGTFIDELGKFITSDNNYFYKPTIALIYLVFILIYLFIRFLSDKTIYSKKTYLVNAADVLREIIISDLDEREKAKAIKYLGKLDQKDLIVESLYSFIQKAKVKDFHPSVVDKITDRFVTWYKNILHHKIFAKFIVGFFIISSTLGVFTSILVFFININNGFAEYGLLLSSLTVGSLTMIGVYHYRKKNIIKSYSYLQKSSIIAIFVTQFFNFLYNELSATIWLLLYVSVYFILKSIIKNQT